MSNDVSPDWLRATLGAVATVKARIGWRGLSAEEYTLSGPFLIAGKHIRAGVINWGRCDHLSQFRYDQSPEIQIENGDVIFSKDGSIGNPALISELPGPATINGTMMLVRAHREHLCPGYLYQVVLGHEFARMILEKVSGSSIPHIFQRDIIHFPIFLPPLDEQRRIAEVLRSVDEAIAANEAVGLQTRATYQAVLAELIGENAEHWQSVRLGELATFVNGRGFKPHEWGDDGLPIIRIQNLNGGTDFNHYSGDFNPKILVEPGDLLFAWSGSRGTSFGPHIWRGPQGLLNYHTWKVVPKASEDRDYLYFALQHLTRKIEDEAHGASALVHMQKAYVVDYEVELPPPDERSEIAATLTDLLEAANRADHLHREAVAMKAHLLGDLLSGRVRVPA